MDRRTFLAVVLCFLIFMGWQKYYLEPRMPKTPVATTEASNPSQEHAAASKEAAPANPVPVAHKHPSQTLTLSTSTGDAVLSDDSTFFKDWTVKSYRKDVSAAAAAVDLRSVTNREGGEVEFAFDDPAYAYLSKVQGELTKTPRGALWKYEDSNVKLTREFASDPGLPYLEMKVTAEFKGKRPNYAFLSVASEEINKDPEARDRQLIYFTGNSIERTQMKDKVDMKEVATPIRYVGANSRYFVLALVNQSPVEPKGLLQPLDTGAARMNLVYPVTGNSITIPVRAYFGPKELDVLRSVDPTLDHTVDFGWFTVFAYPLLKLLKWFHTFLKNYGVAIIVLTLLIKAITYPLTYKSMKSMKEMAKIQPQLAKVKEKYKDDREALNREMMTLMRSHGYNPMAGCLPMFIQMPIFFALYRVLYSSIELYHAPFALWITDLSAKDPYYITPAILAVLMFLQQKISPSTAADPNQQKMMQFMPLIFAAMMITLPSGLTLYYLVNTLAGIVQQFFLNRKLDQGGGRHGPTRVPVTA